MVDLDVIHDVILLDFYTAGSVCSVEFSQSFSSRPPFSHYYLSFSYSPSKVAILFHLTSSLLSLETVLFLPWRAQFMKGRYEFELFFKNFMLNLHFRYITALSSILRLCLRFVTITQLN